jgi:hypothetical protein
MLVTREEVSTHGQVDNPKDPVFYTLTVTMYAYEGKLIKTAYEFTWPDITN